jgi:hypothetical protein
MTIYQINLHLGAHKIENLTYFKEIRKYQKKQAVPQN